MVNYLTIIPFKAKKNEDFMTPLSRFLREVFKFSDFTGNSIKTNKDKQFLYIVKIVVNTINKYRNKFISCANKSFGNIEVKSEDRKTIIQEFKKHIEGIILNRLNIKIFGVRINYSILIINGILLGERLSGLYYTYLQKNMKIINEAYSKSEISNPLDIVKILACNITPYYNINPKTVVYIWDVFNKKSSVETCKSLTAEQIEEVNTEPFLKKGKKLAQFLLNKSESEK
jgi:hypothetical protein